MRKMCALFAAAGLAVGLAVLPGPAWYYSPGLLHGVLLSAVCGLRGLGSCFDAGVVMVPAGACLVAASPS